MMRVGLYRPVHVKTLRSQKLRMLLTHRKLLQSKAIAIENDLRATLRNFGLKVGMVGTVKFEARIKELVENLPDLAILVEPLLTVRRVLRPFAGPDAKAMPAPAIGPDGQPIAPAPAAVPVPDALAQTPTSPAPPAVATPLKPVPAASNEAGNSEGKPEAAAEDDYDDDMENSLSLAAIEAELKPKVVETFDKIADAYKRLRRLQDQDIQNKLRNDSLSPAQERRYKK